jgi:hypothetical protein
MPEDTESSQSTNGPVEVNFTVSDSDMPKEGRVREKGIIVEQTTSPAINPDIEIAESDLPLEQKQVEPGFTLDESDLPQEPPTIEVTDQDLLTTDEKKRTKAFLKSAQPNSIEAEKKIDRTKRWNRFKTKIGH